MGDISRKEGGVALIDDGHPHVLDDVNDQLIQQRLAKILNLPPARFIREVSVGYSFTARVNSAAIVQLIRLATNLNQLTRLAHTLREVDPTGRLGPLVAKVDGTLNELL